MTERVRDEVARWIMRSKEAGRVLQIPFLYVTAVSTFTTGLQIAGYGSWTFELVSAFTIGAAVFVWAYDRFQVLNRQQRHRMDRSDNFAGPGMAMQSLMRARQLAVAVDALDDGADREELRRRLDRETVALLREWRNGIPLDDIYQRPSERQNGQKMAADQAHVFEETS